LQLASRATGTVLWQHEFRDLPIAALRNDQIPAELVLRVALQFSVRLHAAARVEMRE
jgi:hypothetical protein